MASQPKIVAAIPCFNEERFIGSVVAKTRKYVDEVVVIDDGSDDDSGEVAGTAGAIVYRHEGNLGYGAAICSALESGRSHGADILVTIDGDGQHDPKEIPQLIKPILDGQADVVVGSRFLDTETKSPLYRRVGQRILNVATNLGSGHKLSDSQSGCRAYSSKALEELNLSESGMSVSSEIQFALKKAGLRVAEIPISVSYEGGTKRNPVGHGMSVLTRVVVMFTLRQPLVIFGLPGLICLIIAVVFGLQVLSIYHDGGYIPFGPALAVIMFGPAGLVLFLVALMLQAMKELLRGEASQLMRRIEGKHTK